MLTQISPKLPMRSKTATMAYYIGQLGFRLFGSADHDGYLMIEKESVQIHFFEYKDLNPLENYGQVYIRTNNIDQLYKQLVDKDVAIHPNGKLDVKAWGQKEFSLLDPDHNLLTFGEEVDG